MDVVIEAFLRELGFGSHEAIAVARGVLEQGGLTRAGKQRMAETKLDGARELLETMLTRACNGCLDLAAGDEREVVEVPHPDCPICGGSDNRRAVSGFVTACRERGVSKVLVVGGTAILYKNLLELVKQTGGGVSFRFVDGAEATHTRNEATAHMQWAQLVLIWGSTPLPHKVSTLYTNHPLAAKTKTVSANQRGIAALCTAGQRAVSTL